MKQKRISGFCCVGLTMALVVVLVGCKGSQPTPAAASNGLGNTYTSQALTTSYPGALNASSQLMLGMLRLEGTENAITPEQATALLPVAQSLQGQVLKSEAERNAVLAYIEAHLTPAQVGAIVTMHLTQDNLQAWTQDNSQAPGASPRQGGSGLRGTPGAPPASGGALSGSSPGFGGAPPGGGTVPPDMATRQAQFGSMSEQQRAALRATAQAGGTSRGTGGGVGAQSGQSNLLLNALIRLMAQKAAGSPGPSGGNRTVTRTPAPRLLPSPTPMPTSP